MLQRRTALLGLLGSSSLLLGACGFQLRSAQSFAFKTLAITPEKGSLLGNDLMRYFGAAVRPQIEAEVIVDILHEGREKNVIGMNSSGQVREFQLRSIVRFQMRTPDGRELIAPTEITQQRDISFNESTVLAKETEEILLYRDMQADLLQQVLRRLAAIKSIAPT